MSSSAKRALRILETISRTDAPPGVTEIARELSLSPGTVFRSLDALCRAGLVARYQSSARYVLGPAAERLRQTVIASFPMREVCLPYLHQLASISGETASLHVRLGWYAVRIASVPGTGEVTNAPPLGEAKPLGDSYCGEAILGLLDETQIAHYRVWAAKHGIGWSDKQRELDAIRERGFSLGEAGYGDALAMALPIRTGSDAIACFAVEGPVLSRKHQNDADVPPEWRDIIAHVEALARTQPALFENPFAHLDPDSIALA